MVERVAIFRGALLHILGSETYTDNKTLQTFYPIQTSFYEEGGNCGCLCCVLDRSTFVNHDMFSIVFIFIVVRNFVERK